MRQLSDYDVYIFDCDGVILDSNQLKISAMEKAVQLFVDDLETVSQCVDYFRNNFGKSRFHHVNHFATSIINIGMDSNNDLEKGILEAYSNQCFELYLSSSITPGFIEFIKTLKGKLFVASGSEQSELRAVFSSKGLDKYFEGIFGSPEPKDSILSKILVAESTTNAVMFGDAMSDYTAAKANNIDFIFYAPFSNVKEKMVALGEKESFPIIFDFSEATNE